MTMPPPTPYDTLAARLTALEKRLRLYRNAALLVLGFFVYQAFTVSPLIVAKKLRGEEVAFDLNGQYFGTLAPGKEGLVFTPRGAPPVVIVRKPTSPDSL